VTGQRRLLILTSIAFALDWTFYSALTPLLPGLQQELNLSDAATGTLVASYALGLLGAALAAGWVTARIGARVALVASLLLFAAVTLLFGFASTIVSLDAARALQGVAAALTWAAGLTWLLVTGPKERHGILIGTATSASIVGGLLGPLLGALAAGISRPLVFSLVGAAAVGLAVALRTLPEPPREGDIRAAAALRTLLTGVGGLAGWVILLAGCITGAIVVLSPLRLDSLGATSAAIAAVFFVASVIQIALGPAVGQVTDRSGPRVPMLASLVATTALLVGLAAVTSTVPTVVCLALVLPCAMGSLTPAYTVVGALADQRGVAVAGVLGAGNLAWAAGESAGALGAGWLDGSGVATAAYVGLALLALLTTVAIFVARFSQLPRHRAAAGG
jgi:MFS transporter, DHA1 family, solute carrier family 18 (vesicular amine transporter), member 1/2